VGCGPGALTAELVKRAGPEAVSAVEPSGSFAAAARERLPDVDIRQAAAERLPFGDGAFDVAWMGEVLEHVRDGLGLLGEVARVLVPGGLLVGTTPDHGWRRRLWLGLSRRAFEAEFEPRADHLRFFTRGTLRALLEAEGFGELSAASRGGHLLFSSPRGAR